MENTEGSSQVIAVWDDSSKGATAWEATAAAIDRLLGPHYQFPPLLWCWKPLRSLCDCQFHRFFRRSNFNVSKFNKFRHYKDGPVHNLLSPENDCASCKLILEIFHKFLNGVDCSCWYCQIMYDDDLLTDKEIESDDDFTIS